MSVAFRRDSDEEHLEPKFELPIPPGPNLVTARGVALIGARIAALDAQVALAADEAASGVVQRDLRYWKAREITARVAPVPAGNRVEFGTRVTLSLNGARRTFTIVGHDEADPAAGLLSFNAPLSRAMLGAEQGDVLAFGGQADAIEIESIAVPGATAP
ncbi:MAG: GreA/GreB family elongation factor [Croceibacterium sp.]